MENLKLNTLWDGLFHAATWILTVVGLFLLCRAAGRRDVPWSTPTLLGGLLLGWGSSNLVDGILDHQILGIHQVNETVPRSQWLYWNLAFLGSGVLLAAIGGSLVRAGHADQVPADAAGPERLAAERTTS